MCLEKVNNGILIEDNIHHLLYELEQKKPLYFRFAKEAHHALYRAMIEALRGSNNFLITINRDKKRIFKYKFGDDPWVEIKKKKVSGCKYAWRYTEPKECPKTNPKTRNVDFLVDFFEALAMVQSDAFMHKLVTSKTVKVSDKEMKILEWLYREIRNEFEHFMPKIYLSPENELLNASNICLRITSELLFECGLILQPFLPCTLENLIKKARTEINQRINDLSKSSTVP